MILASFQARYALSRVALSPCAVRAGDSGLNVFPDFVALSLRSCLEKPLLVWAVTGRWIGSGL